MTDAGQEGPQPTSVLQPEGFRTVSPLPSEAELADFYANVYFQKVPTTTYRHEYSDDETAFKRLRASLTIALAKEKLKPAQTKRLLDVGFGEGFELAAASEAGFEVRGIDFATDGVGRFHPELLAVVEARDPYARLVEISRGQERFDVCVLKSVLEHVRDPRKYLDLIRTILDPEGVVVVTLPNDYSALQRELLARGLCEREYWFAPPQHLQYFNTDNFGEFAASANYRVLDMVGDFPIEFFLFHPGSNYTRDAALGPAAHRARVIIDLLIARRSMPNYVNLARAYAASGISRTFTAYLRPIQN